MNVRVIARATATAVTLFLLSTAAHAGDPAIKCETGKLKTAGQYAQCRLKAESKGVLKGIAPDYSTCESKLSTKWSSTETKAGTGVCPGGDGDETPIGSFIDACDQAVADALAGTTPLPLDPITCNADLDACLPLAGCAFRGIVGDWVATLPDAIPNPDVCTLSISLTSANVVAASLTACGYLPSATMTGTLTGNVVTAAQDTAPICFGIYRLETTTTFTSCDTATGSYVCRDGVDGPIITTGAYTATRS